MGKSQEMLSPAQDFAFSRSKDFGNDILIIDGLGGSGKSMLAAALMGYQRLEPVSVFIYLDYVAAMHRMGRLDTRDAVSMVRFMLDLRIYENMAGREVNYRQSDVSSIHKTPRADELIDRLTLPDGQDNLERLQSSRSIQHVMTHTSMTNAALFDASFGNRLTFIEIARNPVFCCRHIASYAPRYGTDPRDFTPWITTDGNEVPWYAVELQQDFIEMNRFDKAINLIDQCKKMTKKNIEGHNFTGRYLKVFFEDFVRDPTSLFDELNPRLGSNDEAVTTDILSDLNIPRHLSTDAPDGIWTKLYQETLPKGAASETTEMDRYFNLVSESASDDAFRRLQHLSEEYEAERAGAKDKCFIRRG